MESTIDDGGSDIITINMKRRDGKAGTSAGKDELQKQGVFS